MLHRRLVLSVVLSSLLACGTSAVIEDDAGPSGNGSPDATADAGGSDSSADDTGTSQPDAPLEASGEGGATGSDGSSE